MTMNLAKMALTVAVLGLVWAHPASAGRGDFSPVLILNLGSEAAASGSLGSTRNDPLDPNQYIRCESTVDFNGLDYWSGSCSAKKGTVSAKCTFPIFAQDSYQAVLSTIGTDSFVSFSWNTTTNVCDTLYVYGDSFDEPKLP